MNEKIAMSMTDAADLIGVSKSKMYEIANSENADFVVHLGTRRLVSRSRLEAWIERQAGKYEGS